MLIIFVIASLVNVMLHTVSSIYRVNGTKMQASLSSMIALMVFTVVVIFTVNFGLLTSVIVVGLTNFAGSWMAISILNRFKKDRLWKISVSAYPVDADTLISELKIYEIAYRRFNIDSSFNHTQGIDIFAVSQDESKMVKTILSKLDVLYHIVEQNPHVQL